MEPSKEYQYLLHYTSYDAFVNIINSGSIWAGSIAHQKDSSEFLFGMERLSPKLREIYLSVYNRNPNPDIERLSDPLKEEILESDIGNIIAGPQELCFHDKKDFVSFPVYIASYCGHDEADSKNQHNVMEDGLLSMWRGYGKNDGVAIVFDSEKVKECIKLEQKRYQYNNVMSMENVIYEKEDIVFENEFRDQIRTIDEVMPSVFLPERDKVVLDKINKYLFSIYSIACYYKHGDFSEENEIRLLAMPWNQHYLDTMSPEQREEFGNKPYREYFIRTDPPIGRFISLFDGEDEQKRIFLDSIHKVIISPLSANQDTLAEVARAQLHKNDMEHVEVVRSGIPIRV